jgi:hypothetical protein
VTETTTTTAGWPTDGEWCDLARAADALAGLCDCGVPEGLSEATDPRDRSVRLPHQFDCAAVTAWRCLGATTEWAVRVTRRGALAHESLVPAPDEEEARLRAAVINHPSSGAAVSAAAVSRVVGPWA